ncbi:hypothetical protein [Microbulbifer epialgicus]|uniref:Vitamin K epoxide reductase family protein n=1 Tax=Microbulbifer epialgicus TaxID=393907 RepID=A0ABV4P3X9_9GAMM
MSKAARVLRKMMPVPVAITAWIAVLLGTLWFDAWRVNTFCPADMREGSVCYAEGWEVHPLWLVCLGAMLSALVVVLAVAISASGDRAKATSIAFLAGTLAALGLGIATEYYLPALLAIAAGALSLWGIKRFLLREIN